VCKARSLHFRGFRRTYYLERLAWDKHSSLFDGNGSHNTKFVGRFLFTVLKKYYCIVLKESKERKIHKREEKRNEIKEENS